MIFSEETKNRALMRADLKCECTRLSCGHTNRCCKTLYKGNWHAVYKKSKKDGGDNSISNCKVICNDCFQNYNN